MIPSTPKYKEVTVACVLWVGDFRKRGYTALWVQRLKNMVEKSLSIPHNFICLSNVNIPDVNCIPLKHDYPGWWSKIELFRNDIPGDRVLSLDLDLILLKDIAPFIEIDTPMAICRAFGKPSMGRGTIHGYNSSVMVFDKGEGGELYSSFGEYAMRRFRGDQDYIKFDIPYLLTFPKGWVIKIRQCIAGRKCVPGRDVKILLCMPYKNDVAIRKFPWVGEIWK